tara:strand:- start:1140 stop:1607 length:468 start_codon:yes stop_codon:yes gene_type:complete
VIRDKNIFECIFKGNSIWFPNYVVWGPPSHGHQRRKHIFSQSFPEKESSISTSNSWKVLRKRHDDKRRIFKYDEETKTLNEINKHSFFITGFGYPIKVGEEIETNNAVFKIKNLAVISHAGLIASYMFEGKEKKVNVSFFVRENKNDVWKLKESK